MPRPERKDVKGKPEGRIAGAQGVLVQDREG